MKKKVLVVPKKEDNVTSSGIEYVDAKTSKYSEGVIEQIGEGVEQVKIGDRIIYSPLAYEEVSDDKHVVHEDDIHAIVEE